MRHFVSSAKRHIFEDDADAGRSLTNIKNNSDPRILPWGTREITGSWLEWRNDSCSRFLRSAQG